MDPLVSILIPAYNAERWIADTLRSALGQTWRRTEILLLDDGSSDRTLAVADTFGSKRVRVATQPNQGAAATRNTLFSLCQGDFVQWLDADDLLAPDKIARQVGAAARSGDARTLLSGTWGRFVYRPGRARFLPTPLWSDLSPVEWLIRKMGQNRHMQTATWLVSRQLTEAAGPWNPRLLVDDDGEYFCRVLLESAGVQFVPEAAVFYRASGPASLSYVGRSHRKLDAQFHSMRLHIGYLRSLEDSERTRAACIRYLQDWLGAFHPERPDIVGEVTRLARELGGRVTAPPFSWKYAWIDALAGPGLAKRAQVFARRTKAAAVRSLDRTLWRLENVGFN